MRNLNSNKLDAEADVRVLTTILHPKFQYFDFIKSVLFLFVDLIKVKVNIRTLFLLAFYIYSSEILLKPNLYVGVLHDFINKIFKV